MKNAAFAVALSLASVAAVAQTNTVYGLRLGEPLPYKECPKQVFGQSASYGYPSVVCLQEMLPRPAPADFSRRAQIYFPFKDRPAQSSSQTINASLVDGKLALIVVNTLGLVAQEKIMGDLVAKYGEPVEKTMVPLANLRGARFDAISAKWKLPEIDVEFYGVIGPVDAGQIWIGTAEGFAQAKAEREQYERANRRPL